MIKRIKILVQLQLSNYTKRFSKGSKRLYASIALRTLGLLVAVFLFTVILRFLRTGLSIPINSYFLIFVLMVVQIINIISTTIQLLNDLYRSRDNQLLFAYPVKNDEVFLSKIVMYYIKDFTKNLYVMVPLLIAFGFNTTLSSYWLYYLTLVPAVLLMPMITITVAALFTIPISFIRNLLHKYQIVAVISLLVMMVVSFYFVYQMMINIELPIRIIQTYNTFINNLSKFMIRVSTYGLIYRVIVEIMYGLRLLQNSLVFLGTLVGLSGLSYLVFKPLFFKMTSRANEMTVHNLKVGKPIKNKSLYKSFLKKELLLTKRSFNELINNYALLLFLPHVLFMLNYLYFGMNYSTFGYKLIILFNLLISLLFIATIAAASATAITKEGSEFALLKTAPSKTMMIVWAKLTVTLTITSVLIIVGFVILKIALPAFEAVIWWPLLIFLLIMNVALTLNAIELDITKPKLSEYAQTGSLSHNANITKSISDGLGISAFITIMAAFLFLLMNNLAWIVLIVFGIGLLGYRIYFFRRILNAHFDDIEY